MQATRFVRSAGMTLIELVIVIVVIGILSSLVLTISANTAAQHRVTVRADEFRRNLSHIQLLAISQGLRLRLSVNATGTNYTVVSCTTSACTDTNSLTDPATGANFSVDLPVVDGVTLAPVSDTLDFDSLGRPVTSTGLISSNPARSYTLSGGGRAPVKVSVLPITGFAQTTY